MSNLPAGVFLFMLAFAAAIIGIGGFVALRTLRRLQALQSARQIYPKDARPGYFRVDGIARSTKKLLAPLTRSPCLWYLLKVDKYEYRSGSGNNSKDSNWTTQRSEVSEVPFLVAWEGHTLSVDPTAAEITPTDKSQWQGANEEPDERNPRRFKPDESPHNTGFQVTVSGGPNSKYRYFEERIYDGDAIFVLGEISESGKGKFTIGNPAGAKPFLIATTEPGKHADLLRKGIIGALFISGIGVALMGLFMWLRWG